MKCSEEMLYRKREMGKVMLALELPMVKPGYMKELINGSDLMSHLCATRSWLSYGTP